MSFFDKFYTCQIFSPINILIFYDNRKFSINIIVFIILNKNNNLKDLFVVGYGFTNYVNSGHRNCPN